MTRPTEPADTGERDALVRELSELTLPMMWTLRQAAVRALEPLGVRPLKALLLALIVESPRYPKELSELLDTVPPVISSLLADLEERGLVARVPDPQDRRRVRLRATEEGLDLQHRIGEAWQEVSLEGASVLSEEELRTLIRVYRRFLEDR